MRPRSTLIRLPASALALLVAGCVSFLPPYDHAVHQQLEKAVDEIGKIGTAVSLPYRQPAFSEVEPYYIAAFSHLASAEQVASGRTQAVRGNVSARSAAIVSEAIGNCREALTALRELHRTLGVDATDLADSRVPRTCTIAAIMEERLQR